LADVGERLRPRALRGAHGRRRALRRGSRIPAPTAPKRAPQAYREAAGRGALSDLHRLRSVLGIGRGSPGNPLANRLPTAPGHARWPISAFGLPTLPVSSHRRVPALPAHRGISSTRAAVALSTARTPLPVVVPTEKSRGVALHGLREGVVAMGKGSESWKRLRRVLARLLRWSHRSRDERRSGAARARFWAEAREGEREAEARARN